MEKWRHFTSLLCVPIPEKQRAARCNDKMQISHEWIARACTLSLSSLAELDESPSFKSKCAPDAEAHKAFCVCVMKYLQGEHTTTDALLHTVICVTIKRTVREV